MNMHRHASRARGGFFSQASHAVHKGLQGIDGFVRRYGVHAKNAKVTVMANACQWDGFRISCVFVVSITR